MTRWQRLSDSRTHHSSWIALVMMCTFVIAFGANSSSALAQPAEGAIPATDETISFRPQFVPGRTSVYEFHANVEIEQAVGELQIVASSESHLVLRVVVDSVNEENGSATIIASYDRVAMKGENSFSGSPYDFDSEREPNENVDLRAAAILRRLLDTNITVEVAADGKVQSISGTEGVVQAMARHDALSGRAGEFNQDGLTQVFEGLWIIGEENRARVIGESWTESQDTEISKVGTLTFSTDFSVDQVDEKQATVGVLLDVTLKLAKEIAESEAESVEEAAADQAGAEPTEDKADAVEQDADETTDDAQASDEEAEPYDPTKDPDNLVLSPEAQQEAEQQALENAMPFAEHAELNVEPMPGRIIWDRERREMIERETYLDFTLIIEQLEIFSQEMQTSISRYDVESKWKRIAIE